MAVASNRLAALCLALAPCLTLASPESERLQTFAAERLSHAQAEAEARYWAVPEPKREKLERIDALQQRFDLIESARAVGLPLP